MTIVVTGFDQFGGLSANPSQLIVEALARRPPPPKLVTQVLPTEFVGSERKIRELIRRVRPEGCLCLGVAPGTAALQLERTAWNRGAGTEPDNVGNIQNVPVVAGGAAHYRTHLPLEALATALLARQIAAKISDDAGAYVCNHLYYAALDEINGLGLRTVCAFIHLPLLAEQREARVVPPPPTMPFAQMLAAVEYCLSFVALYAGSDSAASARQRM